MQPMEAAPIRVRKLPFAVRAGSFINFHWGDAEDLVLFNSPTRTAAITGPEALKENLLSLSKSLKELCVGSSDFATILASSNIENRLNSQILSLFSFPASIPAVVELRQQLNDLLRQLGSYKRTLSWQSTGVDFQLYAREDPDFASSSSFSSSSSSILRLVSTILISIDGTVRYLSTPQQQGQKTSVVVYTTRPLLSEKRKLMSEAHDYFVALQEHGSKFFSRASLSLPLAPLPSSSSSSFSDSSLLSSLLPEGQAPSTYREGVLAVSRYYRAIIIAYTQQLQTKITQRPQSWLQQELRSYQLSHMIWHLTEILLVSPFPFGPHLPLQIMEWTQLNFSRSLPAQFEEILDSPRPEQHPQYWNFIYNSLITGQVPEALEMLHQHTLNPTSSDQQDMDTASLLSASSSSSSLSERRRDSPLAEIFFAVEELLRDFPLFSLAHAPAPVTTGYYRESMTRWQAKCRSLLDTLSSLIPSHFRTLLLILCGDETTLVQVADSWVSLFCASIIYSPQPITSFVQLKQVAASCISRVKSPSTPPSPDLILPVLESNVPKIILACAGLNESWLVPSHLADVLYHCRAGYIEHTPIRPAPFIGELGGSLALLTTSVNTPSPSSSSSLDLSSPSWLDVMSDKSPYSSRPWFHVISREKAEAVLSGRGSRICLFRPGDESEHLILQRALIDNLREQKRIRTQRSPAGKTLGAGGGKGRARMAAPAFLEAEDQSVTVSDTQEKEELPQIVAFLSYSHEDRVVHVAALRVRLGPGAYEYLLQGVNAAFASLEHMMTELQLIYLPNGIDLRELLLLEYVSSPQIRLPVHTWLASSYLARCPHLGRFYLANVLERTPAVDERGAVELLRTCQKYDMLAQATNLQRHVALRHLRGKRFPLSLFWLCCAGDVKLFLQAIQKIYREYETSGVWPLHATALSSLGGPVLEHEQIKLLFEIHACHGIREGGDIPAFLQQSARFLRERWSAPPALVWSVIKDILKTLGTSFSAFNLSLSSEDLYSVTQALERCEQYRGASSEIVQVRAALNTRLARLFIN